MNQVPVARAAILLCTAILFQGLAHKLFLENPENQTAQDLRLASTMLTLAATAELIINVIL